RRMLRLIDHNTIHMVDTTSTTLGAGPIPDRAAPRNHLTRLRVNLVGHLNHLLAGTRPQLAARTIHPRPKVRMPQQRQHAILRLSRQQHSVMNRVQDPLTALRDPPELDNLELVALAVLTRHLTARR